MTTIKLEITHLSESPRGSSYTISLQSAHQWGSELIVNTSDCPVSNSFFGFMEGIIDRLKKLGKSGTCRNYASALRSLRNFASAHLDTRDTDLSLGDINADMVEDYEAWLRRRGIRPNTISFYMRILRAVYRRAISLGLVADARPFANACTIIEKTTKRAIPMDDVRKLKEIDLSDTPRLAKARDIFMFLFYCRGMSFIDAAHLSRANIVDGCIVYRRHKTNQEITIGINDNIRAMINRFHDEASQLIVPILTTGKKRKRYETALRWFNNSLKRIAKRAGIGCNLTSYVSRHAWASIAKSKGIPLAVISDALGHDSELTTRIYLANISNDIIDKANERILADL